jgi:hypothetical protein
MRGLVDENVPSPLRERERRLWPNFRVPNRTGSDPETAVAGFSVSDNGRHFGEQARLRQVLRS